jgi:hypothetical protein
MIIHTFRNRLKCYEKFSPLCFCFSFPLADARCLLLSKPRRFFIDEILHDAGDDEPERQSHDKAGDPPETRETVMREPVEILAREVDKKKNDNRRYEAADIRKYLPQKFHGYSSRRFVQMSFYHILILYATQNNVRAAAMAK